jgi:hypothetical protein
MGLAEAAHRTMGGLPVDPFAMMLAYLALTLAHLGYLNQARSRMDGALSEARRVRHFHTLAHVLTFANWLDWLICSPLVHLQESLAVRWTPKTGQVAKRESPLGTAGWPEVRLVEYSEETQS